jgi:hypothetical protein
LLLVAVADAVNVGVGVDLDARRCARDDRKRLEQAGIATERHGDAGEERGHGQARGLGGVVWRRLLAERQLLARTPRDGRLIRERGREVDAVRDVEPAQVERELLLDARCPICRSLQSE